MNREVIKKFGHKVQIKVLNDKKFVIFDKNFSIENVDPILDWIESEIEIAMHKKKKKIEAEEKAKYLELKEKYDSKVK